MKKILLNIMLGLSMIVSGCAVTGSVPKPSDSTYPVYIENLQADVKTYTGLSTTLYLFSNRDGDKRVKVAKFANEVAQSINQGIDNGLTLTDIKSYAAELVSKNTDDEDRVVVGLLFNYITTLVQDRLDVQLQIKDLDERSKVGIQLVKSAAEAVIEATDPIISQNVLAPAATKDLPR